MTHTIAIIGAGPAGCYVAQALRKACPEAEITVIDRLLTPYGLVRYGVAPDHQGTKAVVRQFSRLFEKHGVHFLGNLEIGNDLKLEELTDCMDAVVIATGLHRDRTLEVDGANLNGVYGAGEVTRCWNAHPDSEGFLTEFGKTATVLGNGNVAMDIIRVLAKSEAELQGSDLDPSQVNTTVDTIHIIGRSPLENAKFDPTLVRELTNIQGLQCRLEDGDLFSADPEVPMHAALQELFSSRVDNPDKEIIFHSGWSVEAIVGTAEKVGSVSLRKTNGEQRKTVYCNSIITAIGFENENHIDRESLVGNASAIENGILKPGLFAAGWFKTGPNGTIPENRLASQQVAGNIVDWLQQTTGSKPGKQAILERLGDQITDYQDWLAIDRMEIETAAPGRCRQKWSSKEKMFQTIENQRQVS